jgi:uncharacterized damage-inducible protein DinB
MPFYFQDVADCSAKGESDMELKELYLAQLNREAEATRKAIERVPEGRNDWKPHEKSMPLGHLAALVAMMPGWAAPIIEKDELNMDDPANEGFRTKPVATTAELLKLLDEGLSRSREALEQTTEQHLMKPWRFVAGGKVWSDDPRHQVLTDTVFAHLAHHRGQLTVYLRLNEASVPAIYGPSADEQH